MKTPRIVLVILCLVGSCRSVAQTGPQPVKHLLIIGEEKGYRHERGRSRTRAGPVNRQGGWRRWLEGVSVAGDDRGTAAFIRNVLELDSGHVREALGREMVRAAVATAPENLMLLGVTVLTSANRETLREIGMTDDVSQQVVRLARIGAKFGIDGVVCSAQEFIGA